MKIYCLTTGEMIADRIPNHLIEHHIVTHCAKRGYIVELEDVLTEYAVCDENDVPIPWEEIFNCCQGCDEMILKPLMHCALCQLEIKALSKK
jgi:hypothetical protein